MNNRIQQLAEQAGYKDLPTVRLAFQGFDKEKFAESIVRECAGIACQHMELNEGTDYNVGGKIKQHFGVDNERTNSRTL